MARHFAPFSCRQRMAEIVRRRSFGAVLPLGRHASTSGSSLIQCASVSIAPPHARRAKRPSSQPVQARTGPNCPILGSKWDSLLHAFWSCLLVEHEQPVLRLRARRGRSKQSWLRWDQLAEALEEIKSVEPDAGGGRTRIKAHRSRCRFRQLAIKLPGLLGDESWNRTVLWHRADKLLLRPVPEHMAAGGCPACAAWPQTGRRCSAVVRIS